ncbi:MAG: hypothetical protein HWE25_14685 [Alphaproteobacteria bacterium]|nr:hypothetical protein [Alphaproteobacteria bacterium]
MAKLLMIASLALILQACSVVTLPVKVAAKTVETAVDTASTTVKVAGKVVDLAVDTKDVAEKAETVVTN